MGLLLIVFMRAQCRLRLDAFGSARVGELPPAANKARTAPRTGLIALSRTWPWTSLPKNRTDYKSCGAMNAAHRNALRVPFSDGHARALKFGLRQRTGIGMFQVRPPSDSVLQPANTVNYSRQHCRQDLHNYASSNDCASRNINKTNMIEFGI